MKCDYCHERIPGQPVCFDWGWLDREQKPEERVPEKDIKRECYCNPKCFNDAMEKSGRLVDYRKKCIKRGRSSRIHDLKYKRNSH